MQDPLVPCPHCETMIHRDAGYCEYCGRAGLGPRRRERSLAAMSGLGAAFALGVAFLFLPAKAPTLGASHRRVETRIAMPVIAEATEDRIIHLHELPMPPMPAEPMIEVHLRLEDPAAL